MATARRRLSITFETAGCRRCGGSGRYSYNHLDGDRCFGCGGSGKRLTARADRARKLLETWRTRHVTVAASTLQAGDRVFVSDWGRWRWLTVAGVVVDLTPGYRGGCRIGVEGTESYTTYSFLGSTTLAYEESSGRVQYPAHQGIQRAATPEQAREYRRYAASLPGVTVLDPGAEPALSDDEVRTR